MNSLRKWFYRPRRDDTSLMAQFYYADEELNLVAGELDSFDGRKDPERCTALVNQLRQAQDKVLNICIEMMDGLLPDERALRDFRVKFPDDVMQETLSGQLWFGAECLAAGSSILNRETESTKMRPLAKAVTKTIENVRNLLREQCLKPIPEFTEKIRESLKIFDRLFADFELSYVSAMVPVKTVQEYEMQQNVAVLFSDTLQRAVKLELVSQEQIDNCDPALMFTIPRLAIIAGLVIFPDGPLNLEKESKNLSELFRPFKNLLVKIRELLWTMSPQELATLEKCLCSMDEPDINIQSLQKESNVSSTVYLGPVAYTSDFVHKFYSNHPSCKQLTPEMISLYFSGKKLDKNDRKRERNSTKASRTRARQERQSERFLSRLTGVEERPRAKRRTRRGSQYAHYYQYPEHYDELCPPPPNHFQNHETLAPPCSAPVRQQCPPLQRGNAPRPPHHRNSNTDRRNTHYSSRHHRSRQMCHNSRHRPSSRISTIVCACGSTNTTSSPVSNMSDHYIPLPHHSNEEFDHGERHQILYSINDENYSSSSGYNHIVNARFGADVGEHHDSNSNLYQPQCELHNDYSLSNLETIPGQFDVNRLPANIQNCVSNAVMSDPCLLSPVSFYGQDGTSEAMSLVGDDADIDTISSDIRRLSLVDESLNPERFTCDDCNNLQNCCCDKVNCDSQDKEKDCGNASARGNCFDATRHQNGPRNQEEIDSSNNFTSFSTESLGGSLPPPIPEPRHSYSALRPYASARPLPPQMCSKNPGKDGHFCECDLQQDMKSAVDNLNEISNYADNDDSSGSTSPHHSGTEDDEEVALALQAAEVAVSWKARERFSDPGDLIQRLFVCVAGVADQLQTNYASDLRKILRCVFIMNQTPEEEEVEILEGKEHILRPRDTGAEDVSSINGSTGSEQLSVESAEDALIVIGTPEIGGLLNSPDEVSDLEEEDTSLNLSSSQSDETVSAPRGVLLTSSVTVPPSIFNDHSLMQYSAMSPPPFSNDFGIIHENPEEISGLGSPANEVTLPSSAFSMCLNPRESSASSSAVVNLGTISSSVSSILALEPATHFSSIANMVQVASAAHHSNGDASAATASVIQSSLEPAASPSPRSSPSVPPVESNDAPNRRYSIVQEPPSWIPDHLAPRCMACGALFTVVRRRHHCRNCGKVFCGHCSRHSVPLPHFGIWKNVRVCNACFLYYVTSTADGSSALS